MYCHEYCSYLREFPSIKNTKEVGKVDLPIIRSSIDTVIIISSK